MIEVGEERLLWDKQAVLSVHFAIGLAKRFPCRANSELFCERQLAE